VRTLIIAIRRARETIVPEVALFGNEMKENANPQINDPPTIARDSSSGGFAAVSRIVPSTIHIRVLRDTLRNELRVRAIHSD
jgi:hypothetical protein